MLSPFSSEHLADIRDDARRMVERTRFHANNLNELVETDVIVTDLTMPVLDGIEVTRLIKATHATRQSRVIVHTGNASVPWPLERGFVAVVSKPSPPDVVLAAVQAAVSR